VLSVEDLVGGAGEFEGEFDVLVNAVGIFNNWRYVLFSFFFEPWGLEFGW